MAGTDLLGVFESQYGADLIGVTIDRIRLSWFNGTATTPLSASAAAAVGIRVMDGQTSNLITSGSTSQSLGPFSDPHADWMAWDAQGVGLLSDTTERPGTNIFRELDVKSSRKLDELGESLIMTMEHTHASTVTFTWMASILVLLP